MSDDKQHPILDFSRYANGIRDEADFLGKLAEAFYMTGNREVANKLAASASILRSIAADMRQSEGRAVADFVQRSDSASTAVVCAALAGARIASNEGAA